MLAKLEARLKAADASAQRTSSTFSGALPSSMQRSASSALSLQSAQARLETQQGNLAGAAQRLQNALSQQTQTTTQTINAQRQLLAVQTQLATGTSALGGHFKGLQGSIGAVGGAIGGLPGQLLGVSTGIGAVAAAAGIAVGVLKSFGDAFVFKANLDATTASVKSQLEGFRDVSATYAEAVAFGKQFNITQEQTNSILLASVGSLRSSTASVTELETALIRLQSKDVSKPISEAARALAELESGDVTSIKELFRVSAKDALAMRDAIVAGGDSVQVLTSYLDRTQTGMEALALRTQGAKGKMDELVAATEELTLAQAEFAQGPGLVLLEAKIALVRNATNLFAGDVKTLTNDLGVLTIATNPLVQAMSLVGFANDALIGKFNELAGTSIPGVLAPLQLMIDEWARFLGITEPTAPVIAQTTAATTELTGAMSAESAAIAASSTALQAHIAETQKTAEASVLAAAQQAAQTVATQALTQETHAAVNAFLALNPNLDAAGIASAIAAGKVPPLIGQLAQLRLEADRVTASLARLAAQQAGVAGVAKLFAGGITGQKGAGLGAGGRLGGGGGVLSKENDALAQSERDLALARAGSAAEQIRLLQSQADKTVNLIEKNKLLIKIEGLRNKGAGGGGGAGGAGPKLSAQQKLNNSLLADDEKFMTKEEDLWTQHATDVEKINIDFYAKLKAARDDFEQSELDSNASFYDALGDVADHGLQQAMSKEYETAFLEAEKIAQTKGADVADAFLKAKEAAILAQGKRTEEIAAAEEKGNAGRAEFLRGVDAKYKAAEERKLAAIQAGEGSIASEQEKALAAADTKLADSLDKNAVAADRSADRRVLANERAGKMVDAEALKVDGLAASYDRLGVAGARAGVTPSAAGAAPPTAAPVTPQGTPGDPIAVALDGLRAAINAVESATRDAGRGVESAVGRIGPRFAS